ncbi:MAG: S41 family peptidase [Candidatus Gracilibacteria bacterium]|nr:S41 family peptidase [Candidatus Gracilibacteria bacterium]
MKKIYKILSIIILILLSSNITHAVDNTVEYTIDSTSSNIEIVNDPFVVETPIVNLNRAQIFNYFGDYFTNLPLSYKYINLNFLGVEEKSKTEKSLKKLVYLNKISNLNKSLYLSKNMSAYEFYSLAKSILNLDAIEIDKTQLSKRYVTNDDLNTVKEYYDYLQNEDEALKNKQNVLGDKQEIFNDVYNTILNGHYNHVNIEKNDLIYSAIEGLAKGTNDIHTVYFPPIASKSFEDTLSGEYEGIGSYVDMASPGVVKITSPIPGGPAEKAGLKGGDIIVKVDGKEITRDNSLNEVVSWIKGPAGSIVELTINRAGNELKIEVTREKITIKNLEYTKVDLSTYNIQIKSFGAGVTKEFKEVLEKIKSDTSTRKIIIDLRNNGGGYLNEVTDMLSFVVPESEKTAVVKYNGGDNNFYSAGLDLVNLKDYKVIILQNSGTASASEIMIGTLKDYFPSIVTIGENTYGKGSVQTMKEYSDGSSLKYTVAKWFTGKTQTGIDGVGFKPDIELEYDLDAFKNDGKDNQLEKAINY